MGTPAAAIPDDLAEKLRQLELRLKRVETAALSREVLEVTDGDFVVAGGGGVEVRDGGSVTVRGPANELLAYIGDLLSGGDRVGSGFQVWTDAGALIFQAAQDDADVATCSVHDRDGHKVMSIDTRGGAEHATSWAMQPGQSGDWPIVKTVAWDVLYTAAVPMVSPRIWLRAMATSNAAGIAGEVRMTIDGSVVAGGAQAVNFGVGFHDFTANLDGPYGTNGLVTVQLEAHRNSGSGTSTDGIRGVPVMLQQSGLV